MPKPNAEGAMRLSPKVVACIERYFPEAEREEVASLLAEYGEGVSEIGAERIRLLIVKMSRRNVSRIRSLVMAAKRDFRDVVMWATQPTRTYFVGLLRIGPNGAPGDKVTLQLPSLEKWKKAGAIVIGGLFLDEGDLRGLYIFTVDSLAEAQALVESDPAIASGRLRFEFHLWMTADGLQVGVPKDFLDVGI
jgi:hypothetical protein